MIAFVADLNCGERICSILKRLRLFSEGAFGEKIWEAHCVCGEGGCCVTWSVGFEHEIVSYDIKWFEYTSECSPGKRWESGDPG